MILIVAKPKHYANDLSDMFNFMGVLSNAVTPQEALSEISITYRAVLVLHQENIYDERDFVTKLRSYATTVPIFVLGEAKNPDAFDCTLSENLSAAKIFLKMREYCENNNFELPGDYRIAGLDVSLSVKTPTYFSKGLSFTKTELMIIRTLSCFYPNPLKPEIILSYAFRNARLPEKTSVRTHVSTINKKFKKISGRNLILNFEKRGYVILTPEISELLTSVST